MTWKLTLGKPGSTYIIGKHWVKKNIQKSDRLPKSFTESICPDYIYNIGFHYLPDDPIKPQELWVCFKTGKLYVKTDVVRWLKDSRPKLENEFNQVNEI